MRQGIRSRGSSLLRLAQPVKAAVERFAFLLLVAIAVGLLVLGKADVVLVERLRTQVEDVFAPALELLSRPLANLRSVVEGARELAAMQSENRRLKEENARLLGWQEMARRLEQENASFRRLLQATEDTLPTFISARVVGDSGSAFVRTMLLNAGASHGIERGQAVVAEAGLVGRVIEVGQRSSRLLLLTDLNSRIPVLVEGERNRGVLAGDNGDQPRIDYLPSTAKVAVGDRVVTSGHGGFLPPGLPVGVVAAIVESQVRVQPFTDWHRLEMVSVVRYEAPRVDGPPARLRPGGPR